MTSAMYCNHANENPWECTCPADCYCRFHTCKNKPQHKESIFDAEEYEEPIIETGIPCFECGMTSGLDYPGRKPNESTRCKSCFDKFMKQMKEEQDEHMRQFDMDLEM